MVERELDETRTNVHMEDSSQIQGKRTGDKESLSQDLHASKKPHDFTVPSVRNLPATMARNVSESPQMRHQNQRTDAISRDDSVETSANNLDHLQKDEETYDLAHPQFHQREEKQQVHELGESTIPQLDDHITKKQGKDVGMFPIDKSRDNVIPTFGKVFHSIDNNQQKCWVAKEHGKFNDLNGPRQVMRIQAWTPNFTPAEETPVVPIWISLSELPWHCYNKVFITGLLSPIGKVLYLDSASIKKTRGGQERVKKIEYDNIPDYCFYCKHQGHLESDCTIRQKDEEKKRELEIVRNKTTKDMDNNHQQPKGHKETGLKEEQSTKQAGIIAIPTQNTYINLDVQETPSTLETMDKHTGSKSDSKPQIAPQ
ncbi:hypothetical protein H5410_045710 [Solanum commersonii]|uniref:CCHC-type domain-containing protein n=1 Tax=Solanum commersonii TaxID=4109 RepID=A0A9J5XDJ2_SOLCO|nr:hypothetical protein H5410_045710 [Solanum commersonii]